MRWEELPEWQNLRGFHLCWCHVRDIVVSRIPFRSGFRIGQPEVWWSPSAFFPLSFSDQKKRELGFRGGAEISFFQKTLMQMDEMEWWVRVKRNIRENAVMLFFTKESWTKAKNHVSFNMPSRLRWYSVLFLHISFLFQSLVKKNLN